MVRRAGKATASKKSSRLRQLVGAWRADMGRRGVPVKQSDVDRILADPDTALRLVDQGRAVLPAVKVRMRRETMRLAAKDCARRSAEGEKAQGQWMTLLDAWASLPVDGSVPRRERPAGTGRHYDRALLAQVIHDAVPKRLTARQVCDAMRARSQTGIRPTETWVRKHWGAYRSK
jgi:hypothetical protein